MKLILKLAFVFAIVSLAAAADLSAQTYGHMRNNRNHCGVQSNRSGCPGPGYVWVAGHWSYHPYQRRQVWIGGHWAVAPRVVVYADNRCGDNRPQPRYRSHRGRR